MKELDLEEIKKIQLGILEYVNDFCLENKIGYFLTAGTLIGAIRHKGYIPWDDDIDIGMLRPDFNAFLELFNSVESPYKVLHRSVDPSFPYEFAKVVDTRTLVVENTSYDYPLGLNIDIFIFDSVPNETNILKYIDHKVKLLTGVILCKTLDLLLPGSSKRSTICKKLIFPFAWVFKHFYTIESITGKFDKLALKYEDCNSDYVASICCRWFSPNKVFPRSWVERTVDVEFEGLKFKAPLEYDKYLQLFFGNYMELPPVEERVTHHDYKAYRK